MPIEDGAAEPPTPATALRATSSLAAPFELPPFESLTGNAAPDASTATKLIDCPVFKFTPTDFAALHRPPSLAAPLELPLAPSLAAPLLLSPRIPYQIPYPTLLIAAPLELPLPPSLAAPFKVPQLTAATLADSELIDNAATALTAPFKLPQFDELIDVAATALAAPFKPPRSPEPLTVDVALSAKDPKLDTVIRAATSGVGIDLMDLTAYTALAKRSISTAAALDASSATAFNAKMREALEIKITEFRDQMSEERKQRKSATMMWYEKMKFDYAKQLQKMIVDDQENYQKLTASYEKQHQEMMVVHGELVAKIAGDAMGGDAGGASKKSKK
jgi:hypothetical protein